MAEKFDMRANKGVGTYAGAKIVCLKFFSAKKCLRTAFVECQRGLNSGAYTGFFKGGFQREGMHIACEQN